MDHVVAMSILQGGGNLADSGDDGRQRQAAARRIPLSHGSLWRIVHDEDWRALFDRKVKDPHNRGMHEACQGLCLSQELLGMGVVQEGVQHLEGSKALEIAMLPQVDFGLSAAFASGRALLAPIGRDRGGWAWIFMGAVAWAVAYTEVDEIDCVNIYWAGLAAMRRAIEALSPAAEHLLIDARRLRDIPLPQQPICCGSAR